MRRQPYQGAGRLNSSHASTSILRAPSSSFKSRPFITDFRMSSSRNIGSPPPLSPSGGRPIVGIRVVENLEGGMLDAADPDPELSVSASKSFDGSGTRRPYESRRWPRICCCRLAWPDAAISAGSSGGSCSCANEGTGECARLELGVD